MKKKHYDLPILRYRFISNDENIKRLENIGFMCLMGITNYHYTNFTVNIKGELDTHMIFIDKQTNLLTYVYNITKSYDTFDLEEIEPLVARKIKQMFDNKLLEKVSIEPKQHFKYYKKGSE
ncbi:MAG: hypothetical protein RBR97_07280 [Bacteroidales bacterium]|nr:hypothetical protein [Bacteroidales bacterium]